MSKKKIKSDGIFFTGKASDDVTGSQYLVKFGQYQILLECGLHQSSKNDYLEGYKINSEKFKFKPSEIDYVFLAHAHVDHCGLVPRLVKEGFHGRIITTHETAAIIKPLLLNSSYILSEEAKILSRRFKREYKPIYEEEDVYKTLSLVSEYDVYDCIFKLNECVAFKWLRNSHCLGAAQLELILTSDTKSRKILYTSDLGSLNTDNHFVIDSEIPRDHFDCAIMESTYGDAKRDSKKSRRFDVYHLQSTIQTTIDRGGTVIIPCFSFSRTQEILTTLFEIFGEDESFKTKIVVDSMLSCDICKLYSSLVDKDAQLWDEVRRWDNVVYVEDKEESKSWVNNTTPKIVISSSGFCTNGRVVNYIKKYLPDRNSTIVMVGYCGDNSSYLAWRIKNYRKHPFISINKERVANRADCVVLSSFSSHANYGDLVKFGSSLNTNKLVLVHGSQESKLNLATKLKEAISKNNKTYKVLCANRGMIVHL